MTDEEKKQKRNRQKQRKRRTELDKLKIKKKYFLMTENDDSTEDSSIYRLINKIESNINCKTLLEKEIQEDIQRLKKLDDQMKEINIDDDNKNNDSDSDDESDDDGFKIDNNIELDKLLQSQYRNLELIRQGKPKGCRWSHEVILYLHLY